MNEVSSSIRRGLEFEDFVREVATHIVGAGHDLEEDVHAASDLGVDIVVGGPGHDLTLIEVRSDTPSTRTRLRLVADRLKHAAEAVSRGRRPHLVLASPGLLSEERQAFLTAAGVDYWDGLKLVRAARELGIEIPGGVGLPSSVSLTKPPEIILRRKLASIPHGRPAWPTYQGWCRDALELLFHPPLNSPIYELATNNGHNRRDIVLPNYAESGFWGFLRSHYAAHYIVVDAKNSGRHITKSDVLQLANYLTVHGAGLFGMITCRKGADKAALWTIREQWTMHRKLIVVLNDDDMYQLLEAKRTQDEPELLIRQKIEDFRLRL